MANYTRKISVAKSNSVHNTVLTPKLSKNENVTLILFSDL